MKLYTEEQLRLVIDMARDLSECSDEWGATFTYEKEAILNDLTPIKLPSDNDIFNEAKIGGMDTSQELCFQLGAQWMKKQITKQD